MVFSPITIGNRMKKNLIFICIILAFGSIQAQNSENAGSVNGSFQMDAQFYRPDPSIGITDSTIAGRKIGMNGYGNIIYSLGNFKAGMRYEAYLPPLAGFDPRQEGNGFPYLWASYNSELIDLTVGNFYEQFGNGLIFRSYEEWTLGYDNSMNGLRVVLHPMKGMTLKGIYGSQRFYWQKFERNSRGIVKGVDGEFNLNEAINGWESAPLRITFGGSAVSKFQKDADPIYNLPENVGAFAGRMNLGTGNFNLMTEYAYKINDPSTLNNFIYREGRALLASISYAERGLGIVLQLKRVDNMSFKSDRSITTNALDINFLPPINRTHSYSLTAKYPYATQPNGEMGLQFQVNYKMPKGSLIGGKYGTGIAVNFSQVNDIARKAVNDTTAIGQDGTLGYSSDFFKISDHIFYRDMNIEIDKRFNSKLKGVFQYMNLLYDIATIEGHTGDPAVKANMLVTDLTYRLSGRKAIRAEAQGLWTKQDDGDWAALMVEYTIAPKWFFALADQYNYGNEEKDKRNHYYTVSAGYTQESTRFAITFGRQSEGVVCVGGVCRQVPASSGLTLTISSSF
ncbi:MAG: hypothetical protein CVT92_08935 [Bacteroidetes bacterium HGW-Bacteroidetes-1]|jgi:hypothetical protein|nr:MAG: hypothetical protein CVT92_08935 [Bacteroidetes bacterium HGW-Bacteroidetes-1]